MVAGEQAPRGGRHGSRARRLGQGGGRSGGGTGRLRFHVEGRCPVSLPGEDGPRRVPGPSVHARTTRRCPPARRVRARYIPPSPAPCPPRFLFFPSFLLSFFQPRPLPPPRPSASCPPVCASDCRSLHTQPERRQQRQQQQPTWRTRQRPRPTSSSCTCPPALRLPARNLTARPALSRTQHSDSFLRYAAPALFDRRAS